LFKETGKRTREYVAEINNRVTAKAPALVRLMASLANPIFIATSPGRFLRPPNTIYKNAAGSGVFIGGPQKV
jgi:hypothetical protein